MEKKLLRELESRIKGTITTEYRISYGRCPHWSYTNGGTKKEVTKWAKNSGWLSTDAYG